MQSEGWHYQSRCRQMQWQSQRLQTWLPHLLQKRMPYPSWKNSRILQASLLRGMLP